MNYRTFLYSISFLLTACFSQTATAQFYNGHQMTFGKNRVQYNNFAWNYYRFDRFDVYFYVGSEQQALLTAKLVKEKLPEVEKYFDYVLKDRLIFLTYNKQSEFKQSNVGLITSDEETNTGGVSRIIENKVFVYLEDEFKNYETQIDEALYRLVFTEMMYGGNFRDRLSSSTLLYIPEWYSEGLISYLSDNWGIEEENKFRDGILSGRYEKLNWLTGEDARIAGHAIWRYIADMQGEDVIPAIIYMTRINKSTESGFLFAAGFSTKTIINEFYQHQLAIYQQEEAEHQPFIPEEALIKPKKNTVYQQVKISPDGQRLAYVTNQIGRYKVWIYDRNTGKKKCLLSEGHRLSQITDYTIPIIAWHPKSEDIIVVTEYRGDLLIWYYNLDEQNWRTRLFKSPIIRRLYDYEKIIDLSFSQDGKSFALSAVQKGQNDLFIHHIATNRSIRLSKDLADYRYPQFIDNDKRLIFSSNRLSDTIVFEDLLNNAPVGETFDLFIYDLQDTAKVLSRLTNTPLINESKPKELTHNQFLYLSDANGITNRYIANYDSAISFIDTITHYRYFTTSYPVSDYTRNIVDHDHNSKQNTYVELSYQDERYYSYWRDLDKQIEPLGHKPSGTNYRAEQDKQLKKKAYIRRKKEKAKQLKHSKKPATNNKPKPANIPPTTPISNPDSLEIDINNYIFEAERQQQNQATVNTTPTNTRQTENTSDSLNIPSSSLYLNGFYIDQTVSQVNFDFMDEAYQPFTGGPFVFNPGLSVMQKFGLKDLLEDYRIVGGLRLDFSFMNNELILSFENLKHQIDRQYIFYRQSIQEYVDEYSITRQSYLTYTGKYRLSYPFNQVSSVRATLTYRNEQAWLYSTYQATLEDGNNQTRHWGGTKLEYVFDNTRQLDENIYNGIRAKVFGEFYHQLDSMKTDMFVLGCDVRHYQKIHRNLIWANRFAASSSFGHQKIIYYLGGVDGWMSFAPEGTMNTSINVDYTENYAFQAVGTNMRGFRQNIRNGNSFMVFNSELRLPIVKYLVNHPMNSDFLNSFQVVGFFDAGSAWNGWWPVDSRNAYDKETVQLGYVSMEVDKNRSPFVVGYGIGARARLLGYFVRMDWAWGIENRTILPRMFYLSFNLDF